MNAIEFTALAIAVTVTMAAVDYAAARYSLSMQEYRAEIPPMIARTRGARWARRFWSSSPALHRASRWSIIQWGAAAVGFVVSVKVSMWLLPFEAVGLYIGTQLGGTRDTTRGVTGT